MTDIVERLRAIEGPPEGSLNHEAADEIERLRATLQAHAHATKNIQDETAEIIAENERLRKELKHANR